MNGRAFWGSMLAALVPELLMKHFVAHAYHFDPLNVS